MRPAFALFIYLAVAILATVALAGDSDSDPACTPDQDGCEVCTDLISEFDAIVAALEAAECEIPLPPPPIFPPGGCPDGDACLFSSSFETGDLSEWSEAGP